MEGLDLGQTSNPSLAWKMDVLKINDDDDDDCIGSVSRCRDFVVLHTVLNVTNFCCVPEGLTWLKYLAKAGQMNVKI